jgi:tetratricopeptide (TPR) repeat protein
VLTACGQDATLTLRRQAITAEQEGRYDVARSYWAAAASADRRDGELRLREGLAWMRGTQISTTEALRAFAAAELHGADETTIWRSRIEAAMLTGDEALARPLLAELAVTDPLRWIQLGRLDLDAEPTRAEEAAGRALELAPDSVPALLLRAEALDRLGRWPEAREPAQRAFELDPSRVAAAYLLGRLALRQGDEVVGRRWLEISTELRRLMGEGTAGELAPSEGTAVCDRLRLLLAGRIRWSGALAVRCWELDFRGGRASIAERELSQEVPLEGSQEVQLAVAAFAGGRSSTARRLLESAEAREGVSLGTASSLALLEIEAGQLEAALGRLERFLEQSDEPCARCEVLRGRALWRMGEPDAARAALRRAVELAPWKSEWVDELIGYLSGPAHAAERERLLRQLAPSTAAKARAGSVAARSLFSEPKDLLPNPSLLPTSVAVAALVVMVSSRSCE